jgi:hypothetical protein
MVINLELAFKCQVDIPTSMANAIRTGNFRANSFMVAHSFSIFNVPYVDAATMSSFNKTELDILDDGNRIPLAIAKKLAENKFHTPPSTHLLRHQLNNWYGILQICFGDKLLVAREAKTWILHVDDNESAYNARFKGDNEFGAKLLKAIDLAFFYLCDSCFRASSVVDVDFGKKCLSNLQDDVWVDLPDWSKKTKFRLTHDQLFEASQGTFVNGRVIKEKLTPLFHGGCLSRILHYIIDFRYRHPNIPILGAKSDFKAIYRWVSLHGDIAEKCTIMCKEFALPSLHLTFGGPPCPLEFCIYSKLSTDLANDLLHCSKWDPIKLNSPHASKLLKPLLLDQMIPFSQAKSLDVVMETNDWGKVDIFIDDGMVMIPDLNSNKDRAVQALLLAIHTFCHPIDTVEPVKREDCLSLSKLAKEGQLAEHFTTLGWDIDTRKLMIALLIIKFSRWDKDLTRVISRKKVSFALLESILGKLNHATTACLFMRYFLSRIRSVLTSWEFQIKQKRSKNICHPRS